MIFASPIARAALTLTGALSVSVAALAAGSAARAAQPVLTLTPAPAQATLGQGTFALTARTRIFVAKGDVEARVVADQLSDMLFQGPGPEARRGRGPAARRRGRHRPGPGRERQRQGRGLRPAGRPDRRDDHRPQARRPFLWRGQRLAAGRPGRRQGPRPTAGRQHRRRPALRLARLHAGQRPPFPERRDDQGDPRHHGRPQAERPALAPGRRPGLAAGDQEVSEADLAGRLARPGRRGGPGSPDRQAGPLPGLLHPGPGARPGRLRRRAGDHHRPRDRDARPRPGPAGRLSPVRHDQGPAARVHGRLGRVSLPLPAQRADVRLPERRARRGDGPVPVRVHPRRRRRGDQGPVEGQPRGPGPDPGPGRQGRARPAELVHPAGRKAHQRPRPADDRLGRDPRRGPGSQRHGDVLARDRGGGRRRFARPRRRAGPRQHPLHGPPPERLGRRAAGPDQDRQPQGRLRVRRRASRADAGSAGPYPGLAGHVVHRAHAHRRAAGADDLPPPGRRGRERLDPGWPSRLGQLRGSPAGRERAAGRAGRGPRHRALRAHRPPCGRPTAARSRWP
jgi:hypothetical protein